MENATLDFPNYAAVGGLAHIVPAANNPIFGDTVLGEERNKGRGFAPERTAVTCQNQRE
jgi:hypothetical protein